MEETVYNISINMRREIDQKCFNDWTNKRPTGFKAQWYLEDDFGKKMDIEKMNIYATIEKNDEFFQWK